MRNKTLRKLQDGIGKQSKFKSLSQKEGKIYRQDNIPRSVLFSSSLDFPLSSFKISNLRRFAALFLADLQSLTEFSSSLLRFGDSRSTISSQQKNLSLFILVSLSFFRLWYLDYLRCLKIFCSFFQMESSILEHMTFWRIDISETYCYRQCFCSAWLPQN